MAKVLEMPKLSPTMEEGQISAWHKKEGDAVAVDDLLAEVETDKATMEFRSFDKGVLLKILAPAGAVVKLGEAVAIVGEKGEDISAVSPKASSVSEKDRGASEKGSSVSQSDRGASEKGSSGSERDHAASERGSSVSQSDRGASERGSSVSQSDRGASERGSSVSEKDRGASADGRVKASPYVRKVARERGLDLHDVEGSGPHGRIVARDLENVRAPAPRVEIASGDRSDEKRPLSMMRKAIARRLTESKQSVPHFYLTIDVDADALHDLRERINGDLAASTKQESAPKVSFNDLLIKACAIALREVPECNASFTSEAIVVHHAVDISVAVAVPEGLVTPVIRDADRKSVLAISAEAKELAAKAKAKKLKPEEMQNGTFSISNLGMFGIDAFAAVINPPEGAILAVGQVRREPVVKGDAVVPGRKLATTLSCDHRVVDGAVGASFLKALRAILEHPTRILLG